MAPSLPSPLTGAPTPLLLLLLLGVTTASPPSQPNHLNITFKFSFPLKHYEEPRSLVDLFNPNKGLAKKQHKEHKTTNMQQVKRVFKNLHWHSENSDGALIETVSAVGVLKDQQVLSDEQHDLGWKGSSEGWDWRSVADYYLCSSGQARDIRDALAASWPYHQWFVLVTRRGYPYYMEYYHGEAHQASKCGRWMVVWHTLPPSFPDICPAALAREARYVINKAIGYYKTPKDVVIASDKGGRSLDSQLRAHFIVSWAAGGLLGWASWSYGSCQVANQRAVYYLWP